MKKHLLSHTLLLACLALASNALTRSPATDRDAVVSDYTGEWVSTQEESPEQQPEPYQTPRRNIHRLFPLAGRHYFAGFARQPLAAAAAAGDSTAEEDAWSNWGKVHNGDSLSHEEVDGTTDLDVEDNPDRICEEKGEHLLCKCVQGNPTLVDCSKAQLKSGQPLNTAYLSAEHAKPEFVAQVVNLDHNDIEVLRKGQVMPKQEGNILVLDLSYNRIEDVQPKTFNTFTNLRRLKLSHNRLRDADMSKDWLSSSLVGLHHLYLDWNYLRNLDTDLFQNLKNMTKLVLDGNKGLTLTASTFKTPLPELKTLSLDRCGLTDLDRNVFEGLPGLEELSIIGNHFTAIPLAVKANPGLKAIEMSETDLVELSGYEFSKMKALEKVYMRKMPYLARVGDCAFCRLDKLELVDLSRSKKLTAIHANAFGGVSDQESLPDSLHTLLLDECSLPTLDKSLVDWDDMTKVSLAGNQFNCDCATLGWAIRSTKLEKKYKGSQPMCAAPENAVGKTFAEAREVLSCGVGEPVAPGGGEKSTVAFVLLGLVGLVGLAGVVVYKQRRGTLPYFNRQAADAQLGYANLPRGGRGAGAGVNNGAEDDMDEDGDERRLERDFNRPEFV
jgi:LPXTG-motif cell wall-anchored protein